MSLSYKDAGVDIGTATQVKELITAAVRSTHTSAVLASIGAFGGCYDLGGGTVLVASTDGVGTKTLIAGALDRYDTVGQDLVNHCINDIVSQGARPLFFMDYIAAAKLNPSQVATVVEGVAAACRAAGCALLGGETAEMPGVYVHGTFDLAGTIVGIVQRDKLLPRTDIVPGDALLALPSTGLHTNGYSLARRALLGSSYESRPPELAGESVGDALLAVHRSYLPEITTLGAAVTIKALAHITGGGVVDNLPRVLPAGLGAIINRGSWDIPPIFSLLLRLGNLSQREAYHAFNMGMGMLIVVNASDVDAALAAVPEARRVGEIIDSEGVRLG